MKDTYIKNKDALKGMFRESGMISAPGHLTDTIMKAVEKEEIKAVIVYEPLISSKGWFYIFGAAFLLIVRSLFMLFSNALPETNYLNLPAINSVLSWKLPEIEISFAINTEILLLITFISISISLFLALDFGLHRLRKHGGLQI